MKKISHVSALLLVLMLSMCTKPTRAQNPPAQVIAGTVPIGSDVRDALETYLTDNPPAPAVFYAPTYFHDKGAYALVSLAALVINSADDPWSMETKEGETPSVMWVGSFRVYPDGTVDPINHQANQAGSQKMARIALLGLELGSPAEAGGSNAIRLPFELGKAMQYGSRLIHGLGDYGTSGLYAVDLVGGDGLGTNVAGPYVYASWHGYVDYICNDETSKAAYIIDEVDGNQFVYAHLNAYTTLELEQAVNTGELLGTLRYGTFDDECGWAEQGDNNYHVHWMFEPSLGAYQVAGWTILQSDQKFHNASQAIGAGGWILNSPTANGVDDPTTSPTPSFWDNVVHALVGFFGVVAGLFPPHNSTTSMLVGIRNVVTLVVRLAWVLLRGKLALSPIVGAALLLLAWRIPLNTIKIAWWCIRVWRQFKQAFNPTG